MCNIQDIEAEKRQYKIKYKDMEDMYRDEAWAKEVWEMEEADVGPRKVQGNEALEKVKA